MTRWTGKWLLALLLATGWQASALADSGFFAGGSIGVATTDIAVAGGNFDETEFSWKAIAGYNFDITVLDLAVEANYVNFGDADATIGGNTLGAGVDLLSAYGVAGLELGPIGVFAKAGMARWNVSGNVNGMTTDDSGTDPAYGIGARFSLASVELRGEFEVFDIDLEGSRSGDFSMLSVGLVWIF